MVGVPSRNCFASTENLQPVPWLHVRRFRLIGVLGGSLFRSHANTTLTRPFGVLEDFHVVNAQPLGFAQESIAARSNSRESYTASDGSTSLGNVSQDSYGYQSMTEGID